MQAIEQVVVIPPDGKLPETFCAAFGHKARVIVLLQDDAEITDEHESDTERLMQFAGTIEWPIDDPVDWQHQQRSEWDH